MKIFLFLYQVIIYLIQPILWLRLLWYSYKLPAYRKRWCERYGFCKGKVIPGGILIHSVSVGETLTAVPLVKALLHYYPTLPITVTTMTPAGSKLVLSRFRFSNNVYHVYLPYDLIGPIRRFLNFLDPKLAIIMETEIWPNLIYQLKQRNIPLIIANARMSERSASYYQKLGSFIKHIFNMISIIAAQNQEDGERFIKLGFPRERLYVTGSLKFDISVTTEVLVKIMMLRKQWAMAINDNHIVRTGEEKLLHRPVWIAASTHNGEESIILKAHTQLLKDFPNLLLILVPRHYERFEKVKELTKKAKLKYISISNNRIPNKNIQVLIGDTMGELMLLYGMAHIAFIGGSLVKHGGHNPLEAAAHKLTILMGPYTLNFKDICIKLKQASGLITVNDCQSLIITIAYLLKHKKYRLYHGNQAAKVLRNNQGALKNLLKLVQLYLII